MRYYLGSGTDKQTNEMEEEAINTHTHRDTETQRHTHIHTHGNSTYVRDDITNHQEKICHPIRVLGPEKEMSSGGDCEEKRS